MDYARKKLYKINKLLILCKSKNEERKAKNRSEKLKSREQI